MRNGNADSLRWVALSGLLLVGAGRADAALVFSNFSDDDPALTSSLFSAHLCKALAGCGNQQYAGGFVPISDVQLDRIEAVIWLATGANALDLWIAADDNGVPGAAIESFHLVDAMTFGLPTGTVTIPVVATSTTQPILLAGNQYWVAAEVSELFEVARWSINSIGDTGPAASGNFGTWTGSDDALRPAFRIFGESVGDTAIPEPSSLLLLSSGLLGLAGLRRRRV